METQTATFFELVQPNLERVEARMRQPPDDPHPDLEAAIDHLLGSGGKRIRPILVLLSGGMLNASVDNTIILASAIEMLHTATLIHDDLIDGSMLRRGIPTLNTQWSPGATVLTGDYIFARAAHLAAEIGSKELMRIFARALMTIVKGEISQLFGTRHGDERQDYFYRIHAKTASLFEVATEGAAILSGSESDVITDMRALGYNLGIAFQIVDDVLDFVSESRDVGKPVANDLRQGLITLPTLCYIEADGRRSKLREGLRGKSLDEPEIAELIQEIRSSDAIDRAMEEAETFITRSNQILEAMPESPEREALHDLARYIIHRTY
jgi:geranylgeranyl pyrophosphate synthase